MQDIKLSLVKKLKSSGLNDDEAVLYAELVQEPNTHLQLSRRTNINRTKVYRIINDLEKQGLVMRRSDDRGTFLTAGDPTVLKVKIAAEEAQLKRQLSSVDQLKAMLQMVESTSENSFAVYTYEGREGLKQMLWHELKAKGELLALGNITLEALVDSRSWAENFRARYAVQKIKVKEIINTTYENPKFSDCVAYMQNYSARRVDNKILPIKTPMVIYNNTVATCQVTSSQRFGVEIVSRAYADTMRHIFEYYWQRGDNI